MLVMGNERTTPKTNDFRTWTVLNDILRLDTLNNVKIRFNLMFAQNWNPIELFKNGDISTSRRDYFTKKEGIKEEKEATTSI